MSYPTRSVEAMDDQVTLISRMPKALTHLADEPELAAAWEHQVTARKAEAKKITALLNYLGRLVAYYCEDPSVLRYQAKKAAVRDAATLLGVSEFTTGIMLEAAGFTRDHLPATWKAFSAGRIDMLRLRKIAEAGCELELHLVPHIDEAAAEKAATGRSISEFQRWLSRYIAEVDYEAYGRLCSAKRKDRYVRFLHGADGMSHIDARLPTVEAAAIQKRLTITARRQGSKPQHVSPQVPEHSGTSADVSHQTHASETSTPDAGADEDHTDRRTLVQREADLFSAWLRTGDTPEEGAAPVEAKIMIMIPEATLAGTGEEPATAADRSWRLPADQTRALAHHPEAQHHWYYGSTRRNLDEADVDVLSVTSTGRYPPARLRDSLIFRDGVCRAKGCSVPAERCDLDHQTPWDAGGETSAANLWALCRRHHRLKSHGFLPPPSPESVRVSPGQERASPETDGPAAGLPPALPPVDIMWAFHTFTLTA